MLLSLKKQFQHSCPHTQCHTPTSLSSSLITSSLSSYSLTACTLHIVPTNSLTLSNRHKLLYEACHSQEQRYHYSHKPSQEETICGARKRFFFLFVCKRGRGYPVFVHQAHVFSRNVTYVSQLAKVFTCDFWLYGTHYH